MVPIVRLDATCQTDDAVYYLSATGSILNVFQPPAAFLPHDAQGNLAYTTTSGDPASGRVPNQVRRAFSKLCSRDRVSRA